MRWLLLVAACTKSTAPDPLHNATTTPTRLVAIETVLGLDIPAHKEAARDCRPSQVVRRRFAGRQVIACGPLEIDATPELRLLARMCVESALADEQPFLLELEMQGYDSAVASAVVGVVEDGVLVTYTVFFDSDPCGGSCPDRGSTTVERCRRLVRDVTRAEQCALDVTRCFRCDDAKAIELCKFGP